VVMITRCSDGCAIRAMGAMCLVRAVRTNRRARARDGMCRGNVSQSTSHRQAEQGDEYDPFWITAVTHATSVSRTLHAGKFVAGNAHSATEIIEEYLRIRDAALVKNAAARFQHHWRAAQIVFAGDGVRMPGEKLPSDNLMDMADMPYRRLRRI
jgi:hypothetical protein